MKKNKLVIILVIVAFLTIATSLFVPLYAKYIKEKQKNVGITSEEFYFTVDLLGDTYTEADTYKKFTLAGGDEKNQEILVQNYFDDYRVNAVDTIYRVTMEVTVPTGSSYDKNSVTLSMDTSIDHTLTGGTKNYHSWKLTIPTGYDNGTIVKLIISSVSPYSKSLTIEFECLTYDKEYSYKVIDEAGSPYATLIVKTNVNIAVGKLTIDFSAINSSSNILQIDTTNDYVVDLVAGVPTLNTNKIPAGETYLKSVVNTIQINAGEAIEILFLKSVPTNNYTMTEVFADSDGGEFKAILTES